MWRRAAWAGLALLALPAHAAGTLTLAAPRALGPHEALVLHVRLGAVHRGTTILVERADGTLIGAISPYGIVPGNQAGTYTVPLHPADVTNGAVSLRFMVPTDGGHERPAREDEVEGATLDTIAVSP